MIVNLNLDLDFDLLRQQKAMLVNIAPHTDISDEVEGLLSLIDHIQDQAAEQVGNLTVFGQQDDSF